MAKMLKYMIVHNDPNISWEKVEENWTKLAKVEKCTWVRTCFKKEKGLRYCVWLAPDECTLKAIFMDLHYLIIVYLWEQKRLCQKYTIIRLCATSKQKRRC